MPSSKRTHGAIGASVPTLGALQALIDHYAAFQQHEAGKPRYLWQLTSEAMVARTALVPGGTAGSLLIPPAKISETTIDALVKTEDAFSERMRASSNHTHAVDRHQSRYLIEWQHRVKAHTERSPESMLSSLWESGLSWRDIARLLRVSIAAVQKWRGGDKMAPLNFARLRDFVAAYDTVAAHKPDVDIASWIDVPILTDIPVTPRDFWVKGKPGIFFEYALGNMKPEAALDVFDPDWRQKYRNDGFETFIGTDGRLSIRTKD